MPTDMEKMASLRADKAKDNLSITPLDLLRAAIHDLETGAAKADGMVICMVHRPLNEDRTYETYRCGLTRDQEAAHLMVMQDIFMRKWRG